jgi:hypothetical protein
LPSIPIQLVGIQPTPWSDRSISFAECSSLYLWPSSGSFTGYSPAAEL